jgi:hypothetical protein
LILGKKYVLLEEGIFYYDELGENFNLGVLKLIFICKIVEKLC